MIKIITVCYNTPKFVEYHLLLRKILKKNSNILYTIIHVQILKMEILTFLKKIKKIVIYLNKYVINIK